MRTIGIVTVGRSDYGIYLPLLRELHGRSDCRLWIYAAGMHLESEFGSTVGQIERDGFHIVARIPIHAAGDGAVDTVHAMSQGLAGYADAFASSTPDVLVVLGDRFEMHVAALAALPLRVPVAHIHGGELTFGAQDDAFRHCITKLSHLHFPSTDAYRRRLEQLGESPWRITVSGAPSLDNIHTVELFSRDALEARVGTSLAHDFLLVTYHPATLTDESVEPLLEALHKLGRQVIFTLPNADAGGRAIAMRIRAWLEMHPSSRLVENLGTQAYFSTMKYAAAMVGNSSSGIIEAASFHLPVVDIGARQRGRAHGENVVHCDCASGSILEAVNFSTTPEFRTRCKDQHNIYGDGHASPIIANRLLAESLDDRLLVKEFYDLPSSLS